MRSLFFLFPPPFPSPVLLYVVVYVHCFLLTHCLSAHLMDKQIFFSIEGPVNITPSLPRIVVLLCISKLAGNRIVCVSDSQSMPH